MLRSIKRTFFWLSGAGTETLELCPNWEQRKYVAFGATVLVPCAFAFIACAYALSTLTDKASVIYPVALVWAFIILTIDRALLAGYRPFLSWTRKLSQFALRLCVAILMGLTIAHPLVLLLFRDTITSVIEEDRAQEIEEVRSVFATNKETVRGEINRLDASVADQREKWTETFQARFIIQDREDASDALPGLTAEQQQELDASIAEATQPFTERLDVVQQQADELSPTYAKLQTELGYWQTEYERELNGQRSGLVGEGPRARSIKADQLEPRRTEAQRIGALLEHLSAEKATLQTQIREAEKNAIATFETRLAEIDAANRAEEERVAALKRQVEEDQATAFVTQQNALRDTIKQQIDSLLAEQELAKQELAAVAAEERTRIEALQNEPRRDVLTQTLALHELFEQGAEGGKFAFYTYCILTALFMLVDTIPLIVKFFTKPGPYDRLLDRDEISFDAEHQAFKESHARYMEKLADGNLIAVTRNKRLEHALVDGVEHSRAAREFLDSLIAMERSFAEQMKLEQEANTNSGPEKIEVLDAMKKRFYEDLHRRMEVFFTTQHA
ncbi:conserved hypothetical protein [Haloferula helveola]|uniref:DUF4407 domain-containing protein n=1 Tax=Haloferula helveola TaxID=490095 RepID=A0ABM7RCY2_9BACT|nr:conserved hypothetical protein [Haloferula helveola]